MSVSLSTCAPGGLDQTVSATDVVLTSNSKLFQYIAITAPNKVVYLPDATTLSSSAIYRFRAVSNPYTIVDAGGNVVATVGSTLIVIVKLVSNTTANGVWASSSVTYTSPTPSVYSNAVTGVDALGVCRSMDVARLSATRAVCAASIAPSISSTTSYIKIILLDDAGATISMGVINDTGIVGYEVRVAALSDIKAVVLYGATNDTASAIYAVVITFINDVVVAGSPVNVGYGYFEKSISALSDTQVIIVALDTAPSISSKTIATILNISGYTITLGTPVVVATYESWSSVVTLSPTKAMCLYQDALSFATVILDIVDSVITVGTPTIVQNDFSGTPSISAISSTKVIVSYFVATYIELAILSITGSTIVVGAPFNIGDSDTTFTMSTVCAMSDTDALVSFCSDIDGTRKIILLNVANTTITSVSTRYSFSYTSPISLIALTEINAMLAFADTLNGTLHVQPCAIGTTGIGTVTAYSGDACTQWTSTVAINATQYVSVYRGGSSNYAVATVITVTGDVITSGPVTTINAISSTYINTVAISSTKVVSVYRGVSGYLQAVVLTIAGDVITAGTPMNVTEFNSSQPWTGLTTTDTASQVLITYRGNASGHLFAACMDVVDTTITLGTPVVISTDSTTYVQMTSLSSTKAVCGYYNSTLTGGFAIVINVEASVITLGIPVRVIASSLMFVKVATLSTTKVIYTASVSSIASAVILTVSGTNIVVGQICTAANTGLSYSISSLTALSSSLAILCIGYGNAYNLYISNDIVTYSGANGIGSGATSGYSSLVTISSTRALYVYANITLNVIILTVPAPSFGVYTLYSLLYSNINYVNASTLTTSDILCVFTNDMTPHVKAVVYDITAAVLSAGIVASPIGYVCYAPSVDRLSDTTAICVFNGLGALQVSVLSISGQTTTFGQVATGPNMYATIASLNTCVAVLSASKAVCAYTGSDGFTYAVVLDIVGSNITIGTPVEVAHLATKYISITRMSATKSVFAYSQQSTSEAYAVVLDISDSVITAGTPALVSPASITYIYVSALSETLCACAFELTSPTQVYVTTLSVNGSTIVQNGLVSINAVTSTNLGVITLSSTKFVCTMYISGYMYAVIINVTGIACGVGALGRVYNGNPSMYYPHASVATGPSSGVIIGAAGAGSNLQSQQFLLPAII